MKMRKQDIAMIHAHYEIVIKMKETLAFFVQFDTRKLEQKTFRLQLICHTDIRRLYRYIGLEIVCIVDGV